MTRRRVNHSSLRTSLTGAALLASVAVAAALPVATTATTAVAAPTTSVTASRQASEPLRVASFNIRNANTYEHHKNEKPWASRRDTVVAQIKGQHLDVLGVQEATQGLLHGAAAGGRTINQYEDLVERLGGDWRVTNENHYNCANSVSPNNCRYAYNGASEGVRILYDNDRVELVAQGSRKLPVPSGKGDNYMAWAQLRQRSTGKQFLVSDLHTVGKDKDYKVKIAQAKGTLAELRANNPDGLPMISLGDWNSSRFERPSNGPYDVFVKAGFVDPLGGAYRTHKPSHATVEHRVNTWLNSSNPNWSRKAPGHKSWVNGSYIDYILTTKMRVSEWETVADLKNGKFVGTVPSDHNMIRATVYLP